MNVKIINKSKHELPKYETPLSAGMDVRANIDSDIVMKPGMRCLIRTGLFAALPEGYEMQVRPRSGLAIKYGITVLNAPGTVDADYRGEIGVVLINMGSGNFTVRDGDRIAQLVIAKYERSEWEEVEELNDTERGTGGFGHTGK